MDNEVTTIKKGFKTIFNGKTLNGWKVYGSEKDMQKNYWSVQESSIVCNTIGDKDHGSVWLFYEKELEDFELKLKLQTNRDVKGNSGIQIRSRFENGDIDGPQIDINPPKPFRTGLIYDETDGYNRWIYPNKPDWNISSKDVINKAPFYYKEDRKQWNELRIRCKGTVIKTWLNNVLVSNFNGEGILNDEIHNKQNVGMKGKIALQIHGGDEVWIRFKDIQLKCCN